MGRIILAGVAGSVAMFVMMSILHLSPVAQIGFSQMTNDAPALDALQKATRNKSGLYIFPTVDMKAKDAMAQMDARMKVEPFGIMAYQPPGVRGGPQVKLLVGEFVKEIVQSLIAAVLLSLHGIGRLLEPRRIRRAGGTRFRHHDERFLLELVRLPDKLHACEYRHRTRELSRGRARDRGAGETAARVSQPTATCSC